MGKDRKAAPHRKVGSGRVLSRKGRLMQAGMAFGISGTIAALFYNSPWGMLVLPAAYYLAGRLLGDMEKKKRLVKLNLEFKDYLYAVNGLLLAGYSIERAFLAGLSEVGQLHGEACVLAELLSAMEKRLGVQEPIEAILQNFAAESESEDIANFVEIFCYAKRGGGDFVHIIATATGRICDKLEVAEEIRTVMAQKALEQKIMCAVPLGVLLFFKVTSPEFIGRLYGNGLGIVIMTAALLLYGASFFLGMKIVEIEV